jgi:hypothetical protein
MMSSLSAKMKSETLTEHGPAMAPHPWGFGSTPRTARLRADLKWKAAVVKDFINVVLGIAKCTFRNGEDIRRSDKSGITALGMSGAIILSWNEIYFQSACYP